MTKSKKAKDNKETEVVECNGLYYKCQNCYFESKGSICQSVKFVPLKRKSCSGCKKCSPYLDNIKDKNYKFICENPIHGSVYKLNMANAVYITDNFIDDWDSEFILVNVDESE